jgi:hypothetical protein
MAAIYEFLDRCDADRACIDLPAVKPVLIHAVWDPKRSNYSVNADYLCPRGHVWRCGWGASSEMLYGAEHPELVAAEVWR